MVRHNVVPHEPRHLVVLDTSADGYTERSFEEAVRVAASLCVAFAHSGDMIGCRTTGGAATPPSTSGAHRPGATAALDLLAQATRSAGDPGLSALARLSPAGEGEMLAVVTGRGALGRLAVVAGLRPRFRAVTVVQVGERPKRGGTGLPGVVSLHVRSSDELAAAWQQAVPP